MNITVINDMEIDYSRLFYEKFVEYLKESKKRKSRRKRKRRSRKIKNVATDTGSDTQQSVAKEKTDSEKLYEQQSFFNRLKKFFEDKVIKSNAMKEIDKLYESHSNDQELELRFYGGDNSSIIRLNFPKYSKMTEQSSAIIQEKSGALLEVLKEEAISEFSKYDLKTTSSINKDNTFNVVYDVQPELSCNTLIFFSWYQSAGRFKFDMDVKYLLGNEKTLMTDLRNLKAFEAAWILGKIPYQCLLGDVGLLIEDLPYNSEIILKRGKLHMCKFSFMSLGFGIPVSKRNFELGGTKKHNASLASKGIKKLESNYYRISRAIPAKLVLVVVQPGYTSIVLAFDENTKVTVDLLGNKFSRGEPLQVDMIKSIKKQ